jgi:hypothetical protein
VIYDDKEQIFIRPDFISYWNGIKYQDINAIRKPFSIF